MHKSTMPASCTKCGIDFTPREGYNYNSQIVLEHLFTAHITSLPEDATSQQRIDAYHMLVSAWRARHEMATSAVFNLPRGDKKAGPCSSRRAHRLNGRWQPIGDGDGAGGGGQRHLQRGGAPSALLQFLLLRPESCRCFWARGSCSALSRGGAYASTTLDRCAHDDRR